MRPATWRNLREQFHSWSKDPSWRPRWELPGVCWRFFSTIHAVFGDSDIVHYHCLGPALFSFLPRWFGKKTVVTVQGLDWQRRKWGRIASAVLQLGEWASIKLPDLTMVVSRTLQQYY